MAPTNIFVPGAPSIGKRRRLIDLGGVNPAAGMPAAPTGYHWDFVTSSGQYVTSNNQNVVVLVKS